MASDIQRLEQEVQKLNSSELARFASWFNEYRHSMWDAQIEADSLSGKLDDLRNEALQARANGQLKKL